MTPRGCRVGVVEVPQGGGIVEAWSVYIFSTIQIEVFGLGAQRNLVLSNRNQILFTIFRLIFEPNEISFVFKNRSENVLQSCLHDAERRHPLRRPI